MVAPAKAILKFEPKGETEATAETAIVSSQAVAFQNAQPTPGGSARTEQSRPAAPTLAAVSKAVPLARPRRENNSYHFQARVPVITGEAVFRGSMPVDGIISGQLGASGSTLTIKQRPRSGGAPLVPEPELTGALEFKDMLRINGHIAGKVTSTKGTLIVDPSALVDGDIDVGVVVVSGTVNGDVVGHERVELGPAAIITGNISTRSLTMKPGAVFQGDCRMLKNEDSEK